MQVGDNHFFYTSLSAVVANPVIFLVTCFLKFHSFFQPSVLRF